MTEEELKTYLMAPPDPDTPIHEKIFDTVLDYAKLEERKRKAEAAAKVNYDMVLGGTVLRAFASIDDVLDESGEFSITKARSTGAIDHVKKFVKRSGKYGDSYAVEMYSSESAQDKLGNYLGMEKAPQSNNQKESLKIGIEEVARALANGEEPSLEHRLLAFDQVKAWAQDKGALYSREAIAQVEHEIRQLEVPAIEAEVLAIEDADDLTDDWAEEDTDGST